MNTGEVKGFSMRKELPTGKRELGHPKERHKEKGGTTHERERGGSSGVDWSQCRAAI